jgi:hypothetical protein
VILVGPTPAARCGMSIYVRSASGIQSGQLDFPWCGAK